MKRIFIKQTLRDELNAGPKAKRDTYKTLHQLGYQPITYISNTPNRLLRYLHGLLIIFKALWIRDAIVFVENPIESWRFVTMATRIMHNRGNHLILLIHDIESERYSFPSEIEYAYINTFQTVIVHNDKMKGFLSGRINKEVKLYTLGIFDYLIDNEAGQMQPINSNQIDHKWEVVFCGNLTPQKSGFLYQLATTPLQNWQLNLYGQGVSDQVEINEIKYRGSFNPDTPLVQPGSHFGLIWDGPTIDGCTGIWGEYMRMNNPHKLSLYIALNLPIIVWDGAAAADFVLQNNIGFTVSSLTDISVKLSTLSVDEYLAFKTNLITLHQKVTTGGYLSEVLNSITCGAK